MRPVVVVPQPPAVIWRKAPTGPRSQRVQPQPLRPELSYRLLHATLLAKQWQGKRTSKAQHNLLSDEEESLLRLFALTDERSSGGALDDGALLVKLALLPGRVNELAQNEAKRWQAGYFLPMERTALRDLNLLQ